MRGEGSEARGERGTVVVGVDGSEASKQALRWALRQAELIDGRLRVIRCWEYPIAYGHGWTPPTGAFDPAKELRKDLDEIVDDLVPAESAVEVERVVVESHPATALIELSKDAEVLVVGTRGHGGFVGLLLGSVGSHCVTHASCPVVVVRS